ncbi:MAG: hypothetical protein P8Y37_07220, partial [Anaerolineales bacterium]
GTAETAGMGFVSAGGYHHHIGFNIWQGRGAPAPPQDSLGLRYFTVILPNQSSLAEVLDRVNRAGLHREETREGILVSDPSDNGVLLKANG